jgi:DNA-binding response OmpR family regulator
MSEPAMPGKMKRRIILVDDEKHMLQLFDLYLHEWFDALELVPFQNGDAAWREFTRQEPDLLITDWFHPGLDGGELVRKLAEKKSKVPVLMISACDVEFVHEFANSGVNVVFLQKPFGSEQLWRAINDLAGPCDYPARISAFSR